MQSSLFPVIDWESALRSRYANVDSEIIVLVKVTVIEYKCFQVIPI
ncbi:MAG: hypothetical protein RM049_04735 [Nostoc sp. DedQUE04]|nr:hypothetical protein [Nostoc sp. DedQUE04]MDZ8134594.1 hypothetical protein [Nostoc sp. DedQUE04]